MNKRLYRSKQEKKISGVCGGIAVFFGVDPTIIRLLFILITVFTAILGGVIAYIIMAFIIPVEPDNIDIPRDVS